MTTSLKPWTELTNLEKREAIARRLGWVRNDRPDWDGDIQDGWYENTTRVLLIHKLPDWPTNDGLAFAEVWPLIAPRCALDLTNEKPCASIINDWDDLRAWFGDTWADAICRAAYELLPEAPQ